MKKLVFKWLILAVFLLTVLVTPDVLSEDNTHVVILCTSDMHGNIWGWSYENGMETKNNGTARLYTYIQQVREENPLTFLIDGGDEIQGTIMTDDIAIKETDQLHPVIATMNFMGYDAMTVGNHEFDWGVPRLREILSQTKFPVLSQNILNHDGSCLTGTGWTIIERGGIRLAVIGVCVPMINDMEYGKEGIDELICLDASSAVKKAIEEIGDQADIIMVSAHMGWFAQYDEEGGSDSAMKILEVNPEVDVLQVAHMHITENKKYGRVPVCGVRNAGREIARIDLTLDADGKIIDSETAVVDMADYAPSSEIREIPEVRLAHERAVERAGIGPDTDEPTGPPMGTSTAKFQPENEIRGIPEGLLRDTAVIDLILKVQLENSGADVTAASLFSDTSDIPEGNIRYEDIFNIYKHDNVLWGITVTGAELKRYMEWSAEIYNQWHPGDINISFDPDIPEYRYDMFGGVEYEINLSRPKGERIENVMFKGHPLEDDEELKLAVNNYRYSSAIKAENLAAGKQQWESSNSVRDMIVEYIDKNSPIEPEVDNNWRITGVDLNLDDPRRAELIGYVNDGLLPVPRYESLNLADYDSLVKMAQEQMNSAAEEKHD